MQDNKDSFIKDTVKQIKKTFQGEIATIAEIRESLQKDRLEEWNFTDLLESHHDYLEESIAVLMDKDADRGEKQYHLDRFVQLLEMHGKAEQETLYMALVTNTEKEARLAGIGGQEEHDLAFQLSDELVGLNFQSNWSEEVDAKAKVLASLVKNHIKEEEKEMFGVAKNDLSAEVRHQLTNEYLSKCETHLRMVPRH